MKTIPAILQTHLDEQVNTTCLLLRIERNAGAFGTALPVLGVTTLDQDVTYDDGDGAVTYSAASGFVPSNLSASGDMGVDNAEAEILVPAFDLGPVVEADINAGRYDSAPFILYRVNYKDLTTGRHEIIMAGTLGQARVVGGLSAFCELRSISQQFKQTVCEVDSITCRADFGSTACGVDISTLWETGEVSAVGTETDREFSADSALTEGALVPGIVQWLTGDNAGRSYEIEAHTVDIGGGGGGGGPGDADFASVTALLHFNGTDGSTTFTDVTGKTFTATGNAQIDTAQSKWGGSAGLWDGSGDIVSSTNTSIITLSGDFTVEYWVRQVSNGSGVQSHTHFYNSAGSNNGLNIYRNASTGFLQVDNGLTATTAGTIAISLSTWTHIAVVRDSGTIRGYVDGVQALSHAAQSYPATINLSSIGMFKGGLYAFDGHIDDWRVTNGLCRYPSGTTFTPPAAEFYDYAPGAGDSDFASVVSLLHFDGADASTTFTDVTGKVWTASGNAQIDTAQSKFGGASGLMDGTGDYIDCTGGTDFTFGTGDFTVEFFARFNIDDDATLLDNRFGSYGSDFVLYDSAGAGTNTISFYANGANRATTAALSNGVWYHFAVCRASGVTKCFLDGTQFGSNYTDTNAYSQDKFRIGNNFTAAAGHNGWIDEFRITKGVARYTANFTAPTAAFYDSAPAGGADLATVQLTFPTPFPIVAGDTFKWRPDCGKQFIRDCKDIWNNALNFRGEPYIPVADEASMATPGANKPGANSGTPVDNPWTAPA